MIIKQIIVGTLNILVLAINLFIEKIYVACVKKDYTNYDSLKIIVSISCPIATFLLTLLTSIWNIFTSQDHTSRIIALVSFIVAFITLLLKIISTFISFWKKEKQKMQYKSFNGVFAVSAIILTKDRKFLLVKRKNSSNNPVLWVQPGVYYRTNTLHENPPPLLSFYNYLIESLELECGLTNNIYEPISLNSVVEKEIATFKDSEFKAWSVDYNKNKLSQTPFLIQDEKGQVEARSGTSTHIDSFYAFQLTISDSELLKKLKKMIPKEAKYDEVGAFSFEEIKNMCTNEGLDRNGTLYRCYPDLGIIIGEFLKEWRKELFENKFKKNIRYCTFNPKKNTIWLRLNNNCNLNCQFCLMKEKKQNISTEEVLIKSFEEFWNSKINLGNIVKYHLVITGGEPLLISNLYDIIQHIDNHSNGCIDSITICTNGTLGTKMLTAMKNVNQIIDENCNFKNKIKFVINMASFDSASFENITESDDAFFIHLCKFIRLLQSKNVTNITANVVMTDILEKNLNRYFEFWKNLNIKNIAFSYSIQAGIQYRNQKKCIRTLSKSECLNLYNSLQCGKYPIEYFDHIELMIPACDEKKSCRENNQIKSCINNGTDGWELIHGCLDI